MKGYLVTNEARSWCGTPWMHRARVKGVGVDCAQFLIGVFVNVGLVKDFDTGDYPQDWHLHKDDPRFLNFLKEYAEPVVTPNPGDIAMFKFGRHAAHGSIVMSWPTIIHAYAISRMVTLDDASRGVLAERLHGFYRIKGVE